MLSRSKKLLAGLPKRGFSILEMVVVTAIFVIVTTIVLANLPKFRNQASLDLTAQQVALTIREAQVYGTATKVSGSKYPSYGIHFEITKAAGQSARSAKSFILFTDNDNSKTYDPGPGCNQNGATTECLEEYFLGNQFQITNLGVDEYLPTDEESYSVDLVYTRPFPEPSICDYSAGPIDCQHTNAFIYISSADGRESRRIAVWNNGQITVQNPASLPPTP